MTDRPKHPTPRPNARCPICSKPLPAERPDFPFCSDRCRKIDLAKWIDGDYRVSRPIEQADLEEGE